MRAYIDSHVQLHAVGDTRENEVLRSQRHLNTLDAYLAVNGMGDADGQADDVPFDSYAGFARQIQQSLVEMVHDSDDLAVHLEGLSTAVLDTGEDVLTFFASFADSIVDMLDHNVI
jgi:DNA repair ATPase RecN